MIVCFSAIIPEQKNNCKLWDIANRMQLNKETINVLKIIIMINAIKNNKKNKIMELKRLILINQ